MSDLSDSDAVDLVAEEVLEQLRRGEKPSLHAYVEKYPQLESEIRDLFPSLLLMEHFGSPDVSGGLPNGETTSAGQRRLGDYTIIREVGRGGMGVVYEAQQEALGRRVAIKVLSSRLRFNANQVKRFDREARSVARLEHPAIVPVYDIGSDRNVPFYAMKFVNGQGLDDVLRELRNRNGLAPNRSPGKHTEAFSAVTYALVNGVKPQSDAVRDDGSFEPIDAPDASGDYPCDNDPHKIRACSAVRDSDAPDCMPDRSGVFGRLSSGESGNRLEYFNSVARIGIRVADALHYAHAQGILHRDIKPSNLMLDLLGQVWITDFGLAKIAHEEDITYTGEFVGTLRYTSPEQIDGWSDPRSDIYSLGVTLYELLTLRPAFSDSEHAALVHRIATIEPTSIRHVDPDVPPDLAMIIHKAMAKEPLQRYRSAQHFAEDLQRFLDHKPVRAQPISVEQQVRLWARRNPAVAALSSLLVISLVAALFLVSWLWRRAEEKTQLAVRAAEDRRLALVDAEQALTKAESTAETLAELILAGDPNQTGSYSVHQLLLDYEERLAESLGEYPRLKAKLRHAIGTVWHARSELGPAEGNLKDALRQFEAAGLQGSLESAQARELLANLYRLKRDNNAAAEQLAEVIRIRSEELGSEHPETLQSRVFWLAAVREVSPRTLDNEQILKGLDEVADSLVDRLDDEVCAAIFLHARFYAITATNRLGRFEQSERYCQERMKLQQRIHRDKPNHPAIIYTMQQQAEIKRLQKRFKESVAILRDAQDRTRRWFDGQVSAQEIDMIIEESESHLAAKDYAAMEGAARRALEFSQQHLENDNPLVSDSARFLAEALSGLGRDGAAAQIRSEFSLE